MKIKRVQLDSLKNEELMVFLHQVDGLVQDVFGEKGLDLAAGFKAKLAAFDDAVNHADGNMMEALRAADEVADDMWKGFFYELMAGLKSLNTARREAAVKVNETFSQIPNPTDLPYAEEYEQLHKLLNMLDTLPGDVMKAAHVDEWLFSMHQSYDDFMATNSAHLQSLDIQSFDTIKNAKREVISAYRNMTIGVEIIAPVRKNAGYDSFIEKLNQILDSINLQPDFTLEG